MFMYFCIVPPTRNDVIVLEKWIAHNLDVIESERIEQYEK